MRLCTTILLLLLAPSAEAFSVPGLRSQALRSSVRVSESSLSTSASTSIGTPSDDRPVLSKKEAKKKALFALAKKEGGPFTFNTKFGALNPFAIYYGLVSIFLGIPWFIALNACQLLYFITGGRIDRQRRLPVFLSHVWGVTLMRLTRCTPEIENKDVLDKFFKEKRPAMFVANHNSWMDIPFLGYTVGWRNYKLVSKAELGKVPILGRSIKVGGHIMVDRANRKSQLKTLKKGIQYLKDGVHLCTFPEGTRTRTNRLGKFKNGAFKMAHKAGAPVVPLSIVGAAKVMPFYWMFTFRPAHGICKVVVHEPVESLGRTEEELVEAVRQAMIEGLPEEQRPES